MGHIPEESTLNEYLALGLGISSFLECTACFSVKVSKIPYVQFICGICLFIEKKTVFFFNFLYHLFFVTWTPGLLFEYCAVKPAHNETTGAGFLSVAGKFLLIQFLEFKLKIVGTVKVFHCRQNFFFLSKFVLS